MVVVVAPPARHESLVEIATAMGIEGLRCVGGGRQRRDSVAAGLAAIGDPEIVVIHDAARPLAPPGLFAAAVAAARQHGAATAAVPCVDTIKRVEAGMVVETLDRGSLVAVQTPQAFRTSVLRRAQAIAPGDDVSDDCQLVERLGEPVAVIPGDLRNRKITYPEDLDWFNGQMARRA
jgi:2-C-methyl-D-erythritol 4-phosphate cytidylyltransferase